MEGPCPQEQTQERACAQANLTLVSQTQREEVVGTMLGNNGRSTQSPASMALPWPCRTLWGGVTSCPVSSQAPLRPLSWGSELTLAWNLASLHLFNLAQYSLFFANHYSSLSCQSFLLPPLHPTFTSSCAGFYSGALTLYPVFGNSPLGACFVFLSGDCIPLILGSCQITTSLIPGSYQITALFQVTAPLSTRSQLLHHCTPLDTRSRKFLSPPHPAAQKCPAFLAHSWF